MTESGRNCSDVPKFNRQEWVLGQTNLIARPIRQACALNGHSQI